MSSEAIILAGGKGTRLKEVVADLPKPMASINEKPFLEYLINYLEQNGIKHIILSVGYKAEVIQNYFGTNFNSIKISYAVENEPLGTGGGIYLAMQQAKEEQVFIVNGDTLFNIELQKLAQLHQQKTAALSIALRKVTDGSRYGSVVIDEKNKIKAFREKNENAKNVLINGGTYLIDKDLFLNINFPKIFSFEKDFLEKYLKTGFFGYEFNNYFIDIGLPSTYQQAQTDFLNEFISK